MKHEKLKAKLNECQSAEKDIREHSKECALFVEKRDGQWEAEITAKFEGKPRYTDDRVSPLINQVAGEMSEADFTVRVKPAGGDATKEISRIYDGLIRSIRNQSNADYIFTMAGKQMLKTGVAGWEITQDYADADSFDQEIIIKPLHNYEQRVWIDPYSLMQDNRDANWGTILEYVSREEYEDKFPDGQMQSLGDGDISEAYYSKPDYITIGRLYYKKPHQREIVEMTNGKVYEVNEDFERIKDELAAIGVVENRRRVRDGHKVYTRMFDAGGYLNEEEETVFNHIPIVTVYGNYSVSEGKRIYHGIPEKLLDIQRVHNYAFSREIEEVALAPRAKFWMTRKQVSKNKQDIADLQSLNTNMKPVQFYEVDPEVPNPPQQNGGAQVNPALRTLVGETAFGVNHAAGLFSANLGDNRGLQSGVAIEKQINQGNNGTRTYFDSMSVAIAWTGQILIDSIPKVYDSTRQVRILGEDGSQEMLTLNETFIDSQTGEPVTLNDLSQGNYDVTCEMGAAYKNRQQEAVETFIRATERDPAAMELGRDILYKNIDAPGFDDLAERARAMLIAQDALPMEQLTQEERQWLEQQQAQQSEQG
ncbi:MAG: hypothetical protein MJH10_19940, partial [Epibacterium sp.]|nr:hypothetical protein [Epibacterium sp.]NQX75751.1 hypothetical protein [Epibacterium sp.]